MYARFGISELGQMDATPGETVLFELHTIQSDVAKTTLMHLTFLLA